MSAAQKTAVLVCDVQNDIIKYLKYNEEDEAQYLNTVKHVIDASRAKGILIVYIRVAFRHGYPEINPRNKSFPAVKSAGMFVDGSKGAEVHEKVAPKEGDIVLTKVRVGAFSTTNLATILGAQDIRHIVLLGLSTSGVILSTVRDAADKDYAITVLSDGCRDTTPEVHETLVKHVFPRQATVQTVAEFVDSLK